MMESNRAFVASQIENGTYTLSLRHKGRSFIWNIFAEILRKDETIVEGFLYCRMCHKLLKYLKNQTSNLNRHKCCYAFKQPNGESLVAPENRKKVEAVFATEDRREVDRLFTTEDRNKTGSLVTTGDGNKVESQITTEDRKNAINIFTAWLTADCVPVSTIDEPTFIDLAKFFIKLGATYGENVDINDVLPSSETISRNVQKLANEQRNKLKSEINEVVNSGRASASIDMWSDRDVRRNFLGVTLHYEKEFKLFDLVLGMKSMDFGRLTGDDILKKIKSLFSEFDVQNIESIKFITTEDETIVEALEHNTRLNCSNHLLAKALDKTFEEMKAKVLDGSLQETTDFAEILDSCQKIVKCFEMSSLQQKLPIKKVLTENCSNQQQLHINFKTLEILVELFKSFETIFKKIQDYSSPSLCFVLPSIHKIKALCAPNYTEPTVISNLKEKIIQNLDDIWLKNLSMWHKAAFFLCPPAANMQPNDFPEIKSFCVSLIHKLEHPPKANSSSMHPLDTDSSALTSVFEIKHSPPPSPSSSDADEAKTSYPTPLTSASILQIKRSPSSSPSSSDSVTSGKNVYPAINSSPSTSASVSQIERSPTPSSSTQQDIHFFFSDLIRNSETTSKETAEEEVDRYSQGKIKLTDDFDLIKWWKTNEKKYPQLSKLALQIHSIPASSAAAERAFSLANNLTIERRKRLEPKTVDSLLFLNSQYKNFEK